MLELWNHEQVSKMLGDQENRNSITKTRNLPAGNLAGKENTKMGLLGCLSSLGLLG
jgi:hypothetical protein